MPIERKGVHLLVLCALALCACKKEDNEPPASSADGLTNNGWTRLSHSNSGATMGYGPSTLWRVLNETDGNGIVPPTMYQATFSTTANMGSSWTTTATLSGSLGPDQFHRFGQPVFIDDLIGYASLSHGSIWSPSSSMYGTTDGGLTWAPVGGLGSGSGVERVASTSRVFRFGSSQTYVSDDLGNAWSVANPPLGQIKDMVFVDELHGFATGNAGIYASTDGGATWQSVSGQGFVQISHKDPSIGIAARGYPTASGELMRTTNGWADSELLPTPPELGGPASIFFDGNGRLYASRDERLYVSLDLGNTWSLELEMMADHRIAWVTRVGDHVVVASTSASWAYKLDPL